MLFKLSKPPSSSVISETKCHRHLIDDDDNKNYNTTIIATVKCADYQCRRRSLSKLSSNKKQKPKTTLTYQYTISLLIELEREEENETCLSQQTETIQYELSKKKCPGKILELFSTN